MNKTNVLVIIIIFILISCKDEDLTPEMPMVLTGSVVDISPQGTVFTGRILTNVDLLSEEKGFVWDTIANPSIEKSYTRFTGELNEGTFSKQVDFDLIPDKKYYVRAYMNYGSNIIYGNQVTFESKGSNGPLVESFSPEIGVRSDTIAIFGDNFSNRKTNNIVKIGDLICQVIETSKNKLKVVLPSNIYESGVFKITVEVIGIGIAITNDNFKIDGPIVSNVYPLSGPCNSEDITIEGSGFSNEKYGNEVYLTRTEGTVEHRTKATVTFYSEDKIIILRPNLWPGEYKVSVRSNYVTHNASFAYRAIGTRITSIQPLEGIGGTIVTLKGQHLNNSQLRFGNHYIAIPEDDSVEFTFPVPYNLEQGSYLIGVQSNCDFIEYDKDFQLISAWNHLTNFAGSVNLEAISFTIGNKFYVLFGRDYCNNSETKNELWAYDDNSKIWERKADFPYDLRPSAALTTVKNKAYFGTGGRNEAFNLIFYNDFWEYDAEKNLWTRLSDLPESGRLDATIFSVNDKVYVGGGISAPPYENSNKFYEYDILTDNWIEINNLPEILYWKKALSYIYNNKIYLIEKGPFSPNFIEFDPMTKSWIEMGAIDMGTDATCIISNESQSFIIDYYGTEVFWIDPMSGSKTNIQSFSTLGTRYNSTGAILGSKLVIGLGNKDQHCYNNFLYLDISEYE